MVPKPLFHAAGGPPGGRSNSPRCPSPPRTTLPAALLMFYTGRLGVPVPAGDRSGRPLVS